MKQKSISRLALYSSVLFTLSLIFYLFKVMQYDWYSDFFQEFERQKIQRYRLVQIWVQGDKDSPSPIGGSEHDFKVWKFSFEALLKRAQLYAPKALIHLELVVDQPTYQLHSKLFHQWKYSYPDVFVITSIDSLKNAYPLIKEPLKQCTEGIPALCSDIIRVWHLHQPYDLNLYMDIDTFIYHSLHRYHPYKSYSHKGIKSSTSLGLEGKLSSVSFSYKLEPDASKIITNNDILVDRANELNWERIKARAFDNLNQIHPLLEFITQRRHYSKLTAVDYWPWLQQKVDCVKENSSINFNQIPLVMSATGPVFWRKLYFEGFAIGYELPFIPSAGTWMNRVGSIYGNASGALLNEIFEADTASLLIRFIMISHDYQYFLKQDVPWVQDLKFELDHLYHQFTPDVRILAQSLLHAPFDWYSESSHD